MRARLTSRARRDLGKILRYSALEFGLDAAERYEALLMLAIEQVGATPLISGSRPVAGRRGLRSFSISRSRLHVVKERRVQNPAHKLVYHVTPDGVVEVLAVIGESYPATRVVIP